MRNGARFILTKMNGVIISEKYDAVIKKLLKVCTFTLECGTRPHLSRN